MQKLGKCDIIKEKEKRFDNKGVEYMRKHYMTLCFRGNTEVTHIVHDGRIEVTYEQAVNGGFHTLVVDINGNVISNDGFNDSEVDFFRRFTVQNAPAIIMESRGEI